MTWLNPDCRDGKHRACRGDAWDVQNDRATNCWCECHQIDLARTRVVLAGLQGDQERLHAELELTGILSFADRADWLLSHRSPDEQLAWRRHWLALGLTDIAPGRRIHGAHSPTPTSPCVRCGLLRKVRVGRGSLCADCRYVLSDDEIALWAEGNAA